MSKEQVRKHSARKTNYEIIPSDLGMMGGFSPNVIESDNHTLISNNVPSSLSPLEGEEGIFQQSIEYNIHKLFVGDFDDYSGHGLNKIVNKLQEAPFEDVLELHISSYGGSFAEVVQLHNLIDSMYKSRSTSYLNHGYSGGAMSFVMCPERIVYEHSVAMFHFFSGGERGKGSDMLSALNHSISTIGKYYRNMLKDYFTTQELDLMIYNGKEFWLNSTEMLERDIATGIILDGQYLTKDEYFERYDKDGNLKPEFIESTTQSLIEENEIYKFRTEKIEQLEKEVDQYVKNLKSEKNLLSKAPKAPKAPKSPKAPKAPTREKK